MGWLKMIFGTASGVSPWLLGGLFVVGLLAGGGVAYVWQEREIDGLIVERDALKNSIEGEFGLNAQIKGLQKGIEDRDAANARLNAKIDEITAAAQDTQQATLELLDEAQARADETEKKLAALRRQANAAQEADKPRPISPTAGAAYDWGLCRTRAATAGADPAAC